MAKAEATVEELVGMIERGELRLPEMQRRSTRLLLDGQQRLTSLSAVIRGEPVGGGGAGSRSSCSSIWSTRTSWPSWQR